MKNPFKSVLSKISNRLHKRKLRQIRKKQQKEYDKNRANSVFTHPNNIPSSPLTNNNQHNPNGNDSTILPLNGNVVDTLTAQPVTISESNRDQVVSLSKVGTNGNELENANGVLLSPKSTCSSTGSNSSTPTVDSPAFDEQLSDYKKIQRERYQKMQQERPVILTKSSNGSPYNRTPSTFSKSKILKKASINGMKSKYTIKQYPSLDFKSKDGCLWVNDHVFKLKGVNWFGCETETSVVHGLWSRDYKQYIEFLSVNNFNAIRIPFSLEMVLKDPFPTSISISPAMNSDLHGLRSLSVLDIIIEAAGEKGMLVLLDLHSFGPNDRLHDGLWYNSYILILRYGKTWNVLGVDLKNEPYSATWNTGNPMTDWDKAINRIGSYIQNNGGNRWLIFGQGVPSQQSSQFSCCWGESFETEGRPDSTISLPNMEKFVYSPHCYGPSVVNHAHFRNPGFPGIMVEHWDLNFGLLPTSTKRAVVVGEWGGRYTEQLDRVWMDCFVRYLKDKGCTDSFYWCLNPNSGDTGGILADDWITINQEKLELLGRLCPHPTKIQYDKDTQVFTVISHIKNNNIHEA
ncbi:hypothetical protein PPL_07915 [Heterostelium album PN500]|uniref:Glycoside hydrolase family 5 domain-containing protein n=1 Tax=Heterostelium pallidum (strain ATCC 26659 / Pp 5 / PN500) TaxID=670386 RepID=D3BHB3_HETP5|nr:hypothetical protein PPL_07915 [Heterostelium album PN500]EFA79090.1 hypothetical protein PPL_07915 [Heterostelium album PN500]|eukprot:XP_020431212.1 hypothetical protein PPL_07915 [Heterostelium album PN500]